MALRLGTILRGSKYSFRLVEKLGDKTVSSPVFKAEVLPGIQSLLPKHRLAVVKSANLENQTQVDCLLREYTYYKKPSVESSRNFRKFCDTVNNPTDWTAQKPFCLVFEWMDMTLAEVPVEEFMKDPVLVTNLVKMWADLAMDVGIPKVVLDVIRLLAVPDPTNRPSTLQALQSPEYAALQKAAAAYGN